MTRHTSHGKPSDLEFGGLVGLTAEIEAAPGQIVRWGQRDNRGNRGENNWGIVGRNGEVTESTPEECRTHWLAGCSVPKDADDDDKVVNFPAH